MDDATLTHPTARRTGRRARWAWLSIALAALAGPPESQDARGTSASTEHLPAGAELRRLDGVPCLACGQPIDGEGCELVHRGRRVRLHTGHCIEAWRDDPDALFAQLQPRAALFHEPSQPSPRPASGWLWLGVYVLAGLLCGAVAAYGAIDRGLSAPGWFAAGLFLNVLAEAALLTRPRAAAVPAPKGCPGGCARCR